jgi:hypothetical protein
MILDIQRYWGEREIYYPGELSSKIIHSMQTDGWVTLRSKEIRSATHSGLYALLDQLCNYWKWNRDNITLETGNIYDVYYNQSCYPVKLSLLSEPLIETRTDIIEHRPWNREKTYGMFIGRANITRLRAAHQHKNFEFRDQGLTSFNHDMDLYTDPCYLLEYLTQSDQSMSEIKNIKSYSDIGPVQQPPITHQFSGSIWNDVYEKIAIEIVLETAEDQGTFSITEKILRPILYKRPFFLIAGQGVITDVWKKFDNFSKDTRFAPPGTLKFFENVIPADLDQDGGIHRVDYAFSILHKLIRTNKINTILEDCRDDIEHNYQYMMQYIQNIKQYKEQYNQMLDPLSWTKPIINNNV